MTITTLHKCSIIPILRQRHQMTPNWYSSLQCQSIVPISALTSRCAKFQSASLYDQSFRVAGYSETSALNGLHPHNNIEHCRFPQIHVLRLSPSFCDQPILSLLIWDQSLSWYMPFWHKSTKWPHNDLAQYYVKDPVMCYLCVWVPHFTPLSSTPSRLRVTGHFGINAQISKSYPIYVVPVSRVPNLSSFHPTTSHYSNICASFHFT